MGFAPRDVREGDWSALRIKEWTVWECSVVRRRVSWRATLPEPPIMRVVGIVLLRVMDSLSRLGGEPSIVYCAYVRL